MGTEQATSPVVPPSPPATLLGGVLGARPQISYSAAQKVVPGSVPAHYRYRFLGKSMLQMPSRWVSLLPQLWGG